MRSLLTILLIAFMLSACTMLYSKEYVAEPKQEMTADETEAVFHAFRDYLVAKGLNPINYGQQSDPNRIAFRIGGSDSGFAFRQDWEDILELKYSGAKGFHLRLVRIVHHPADFSDEYLKQFVEQTEAFLREATSKSIQLTLVPNEGP